MYAPSVSLPCVMPHHETIVTCSIAGTCVLVLVVIMKAADEEQMCVVCLCVWEQMETALWSAIVRMDCRHDDIHADIRSRAVPCFFLRHNAFYPLHFIVSNVIVQRYLCSHELDEETSAPWDWMRCAEEGRARERRVDHPQGHAKRGKCRCSIGITLDNFADANLRSSRVTLQKLVANSADVAKL